MTVLLLDFSLHFQVGGGLLQLERTAGGPMSMRRLPGLAQELLEAHLEF